MKKKFNTVKKKSKRRKQVNNRAINNYLEWDRNKYDVLYNPTDAISPDRLTSRALLMMAIPYFIGGMITSVFLFYYCFSLAFSQSSTRNPRTGLRVREYIFDSFDFITNPVFIFFALVLLSLSVVAFRIAIKYFWQFLARKRKKK